MTERQKEVLGKIWGYMRSNGIAPSYADLMKQLGISSKQTMADLLYRLEKMEYIKRDPARARGISLTPKALVFLVDEGALSLGTQFIPNITPILEYRENSTSACSLSKPHSDYTNIKITDGVSQLSLFDVSNTATSKRGSSGSFNSVKQLVSEKNILWLSEILKKLFNATHDTYVINAENVSFYFGHIKYERNVLSKIKLNLKGRIEKLFDLLKGF